MNPVIRSKRFVNIIDTARYYNCRPSELCGITQEYEAFCFDEACAYIGSRLLQGEKPQFEKLQKGDPVPVKKYKSFTDIYKPYERGNVN